MRNCDEQVFFFAQWYALIKNPMLDGKDVWNIDVTVYSVCTERVP